jgi:putative transposase
MDLSPDQKKTTAGLRIEEKKALIDFHDAELTIRHQCELLELPRSTAYYQSTAKPDPDEIEIKNAMDRIHYDEPSYGCRRIRNELKRLGWHRQKAG